MSSTAMEEFGVEDGTSSNILMSLTPPTSESTPSNQLLESLGNARIAFHTRSSNASTAVSWISSKHIFPVARPSIQHHFWHQVQRLIPLPSNERTTRQDRGLTLVFVQSSDIPTETVEPMLQELVGGLDSGKEGDLHVAEIFCLKALQDVLHFLESYMPMQSSLRDLSLFGPHWYSKVLVRQSTGKAAKDRNIVLVGLGQASHGAVKSCAVSEKAYVDRMILYESIQLDSRPSLWNARVQSLYERFAESSQVCLIAADGRLNEESGYAASANPTLSDYAGPTDEFASSRHLQQPEEAGKAMAAVLQGRTQAIRISPTFRAHL